jgi:hypothetical protein
MGLEMNKETLESYWSEELGESVEIREWPDWGEVDLYLSGQFAVTVTKLEFAEAYLSRYACLKPNVPEGAIL